MRPSSCASVPPLAAQTVATCAGPARHEPPSSGPRTARPRPWPSWPKARPSRAGRHRADPAGQRRLHPARAGRAPQAQLVLFGAEEPAVAAAAVAAGARGVIRGVDARPGQRRRQGAAAALLPVRPASSAGRGPAVAGGGRGAPEPLRPLPAEPARRAPTAVRRRGRRSRPARRARPSAATVPGGTDGPVGRARRPPGHADRAGAAGAARHGRRQEQRGDRPGAVRLRGHRQDPRPAAVPQAGRPRPGPRGGGRLPGRPGRAEVIRRPTRRRPAVRPGPASSSSSSSSSSTRVSWTPSA